MATVIVRHKVGDFNVWKQGHDERLKIFAPAIKGYQGYQDAGDPNSVVLVIEYTDLELLGNIINDPKNAVVKEKHTVKEPITLSMEISF